VAVLSDTDRVSVWASLMRAVSDARESVALTKIELRAAIDATDDWVNTNAASFNSALPAAARSSLTARQKAWLLVAIITRRFEVS
jgi:hypothetical protein